MPSAISASERLPQTVAGAFGKTAVKSSVSNVDRLNTLEKELQAMFAEGAPVPKVSVIRGPSGLTPCKALMQVLALRQCYLVCTQPGQSRLAVSEEDQGVAGSAHG